MEMSKLIPRLTKHAVYLSVIAEAEKIFGHGILRNAAPGITKWPLIYTSELFPAVAVGFITTTIGLRSRAMWEYLIAGHRDKERMSPVVKKLIGASVIGLSGVLSTVPAVAGMSFELTDKCNIIEAEEQNILACKPDAVDAASIAIGVAMGMYCGALRQRIKHTSLNEM